MTSEFILDVFNPCISNTKLFLKPLNCTLQPPMQRALSTWAAELVRAGGIVAQWSKIPKISIIFSTKTRWEDTCKISNCQLVTNQFQPSKNCNQESQNLLHIYSQEPAKNWDSLFFYLKSYKKERLTKTHLRFTSQFPSVMDWRKKKWQHEVKNKYFFLKSKISKISSESFLSNCDFRVFAPAMCYIICTHIIGAEKDKC